MELFIQMGHNMQALALEHLEEFDGGTIIISPMNILPNKVKGYATRVHKKKGKVLVDRSYRKKSENRMNMEMTDTKNTSVICCVKCNRPVSHDEINYLPVLPESHPMCLQEQLQIHLPEQYFHSPPLFHLK